MKFLETQFFVTSYKMSTTNEQNKNQSKTLATYSSLITKEKKKRNLLTIGNSATIVLSAFVDSFLVLDRSQQYYDNLLANF